VKRCLGGFVGFAVALAWLACWLAPSLPQSLWVDELHTAWVTGGTWSEVAPRAAAGNQPPLWFWFMKGVRRGAAIISGDPNPYFEILLRGPSLIAWAGASAALAWLVAADARRSDGRGAGGWGPAAIAAVLMVTERNALFFASEARSYAAIVATAVSAAVALNFWLRGRWFAWRIVWWVLAALSLHMHYTAALTVASLWTWLLIETLRRDGPRYAVEDALAIALLALPLGPAMIEVWQRRTQWEAFASLDDLGQVVRLWPWAAFLLPPLLVGGIIRIRGPVQGEAIEWSAVRGAACWLLVPMSIAVLMSVSGTAPLWHRRYLLGTLPPLVWITTWAWRWALPQSRRAAPWIAATVLSGACLLWSQGTLGERWSGDGIIARRSEDWRAASRWINELREQDEDVGICAWLLEGEPRKRAVVGARGNGVDQGYLAFPLADGYRVPGSVGFSNDPEQWREFATRSGHGFLLVRGSGSAAEPLQQRWVPRGAAVEFRAFPGILVWRFDVSPTVKEGGKSSEPSGRGTVPKPR
jgi:hypothetical protein